MQRSEELSLCVTDEEDNAMLLVHPINPEDIYRKQEGRFFCPSWVLFLCVCVDKWYLFNVQTRLSHGETLSVQQKWL